MNPGQLGGAGGRLSRRYPQLAPKKQHPRLVRDKRQFNHFLWRWERALDELRAEEARKPSFGN